MGVIVVIGDYGSSCCGGLPRLVDSRGQFVLILVQFGDHLRFDALLQKHGRAFNR